MKKIKQLGELIRHSSLVKKLKGDNFNYNTWIKKLKIEMFQKEMDKVVESLIEKERKTYKKRIKK